MVHAIGIDVGTTNTKVALVRDDGTVLARATRSVATRRVDGGGAEQDPLELWGAVAGAVREVVAAGGIPAADITAVSCASQYSSIVPVDAAGHTTADLVLWYDGRGGEHALRIYERHPEALLTWIDHHGIPPLPSGMDSLCHILHLQHDRPEVHAATAAYLEPMDFVNLRLTGRAAANQCTMFMALLCDNRTLGVTEYDAELVAMAGVDAERLPELIPVDGAVGTVLPEVAAELGLDPATVVYAGCNDTQAGAIATGVLDRPHGGVSIGTTSVMIDGVGRKDTDADHEILSMPSPLPGRYLVMAENGVGGRALEHALHELFLTSDELGDHAEPDAYAALDALLERVPAGAGGVLFLPWLNGSLAPSANPLMRGAFLNLSLETGRAELVRAVVEGISYNLAWLLPAVESFTGNRMEAVVLNGGAAASRELARTLADVLDRPVRPLVDPAFAVARATALLGLHRAGRLGLDELDAAVRWQAEYEPRPARRAVHERMLEQFVAAHEATRPVFEALNSPPPPPAAQEGARP